jgi:hypothetical protein
LPKDANELIVAKRGIAVIVANPVEVVRPGRPGSKLLSDIGRK